MSAIRRAIAGEAGEMAIDQIALQNSCGKNFLTDDIGRAQMVPEVRSAAAAVAC